MKTIKMMCIILSVFLSLSNPALACKNRDEEIKTIAKILWIEARGEDYDSIVMVGDVIMNRVAHPKFPSTVCGVVYQKNQFSGASTTKTPSGENMKRFIDISRMVLEKDERSTDALFFHSKSSGIDWSGTYKRVGTKGNHVFYTYRNG